MTTYSPLFIQNLEHFEPFTLTHTLRMIEPLSTATKEEIQSAFRYLATQRYKINIHDGTAICKKMVELFKNCKCYHEKTESEKQEIIDYLNAHPEEIELYTLNLSDDED